MLEWIQKRALRVAIVIFWVVVLLGTLRLSQYAYFFKKPRTLYIATWPLLLDAKYLKAFEKEAGITLQISYFERSEELLAKVQATGGKGYDIIFPSDYTVAQLVKMDLLKEIDKSKLDFWDDIDTRFLSHYFDPENRYSMPFFWGVFGLGFNKKVYGDTPPATLGLIFDPAYNPEHVVMSDNARESVLVAAQYLFGTVDALKQEAAQQKVKELLINQKQWVDIYTDERIDELLSSENNPIAFGLSTDISRAVRENPEHIAFMIPKEGSFFIIDTIALPKGANAELAYEFINYMYRPEVVAHHIEKYNMLSPLRSTGCVSAVCPNDKMFNALHLMRDVVSEDVLNDIWIALLAD